MNNKRKILKIIKIIIVLIPIFLIISLLLRMIVKTIYNRDIKGGINESMYVDINGTKQWINIYGKNINNPVLLYLHGGPGSATSHIDYKFTRKWSDVYTIITWDQRNCGKSYDKKQNDIILTKKLMLDDGKELTKFILKYLSKDKISILGHSWGSIYGANLVLECPEYFDCFIGTGQLVDTLENENAFKQEALIWANDDEKSLKLVKQLTPNKLTTKHFNIKNKIMKKYGYDMMANGTDYNLISTMFFNPNYTINDWIKFLSSDIGPYLDFISSDEFLAFSLKNRTEYQVSFYNINGDKDYQTNYKLATNYFKKVKAPYKKMYMMKNMTHGLLESDTKEFSKIIHKISQIEKQR